MAVWNAGNDIKETEWSLALHNSEGLSMVPCSEEKIFATVLVAEVLNTG